MNTNAVSGALIRRLMRKHHVRIAQLAEHYQLPRQRVRHVRQHGGPWDWPLMIRTCAQAAAEEETKP